jgi:serine/threonine protein kinase
MNPRDIEFEKKEKLGSGSFGTVWLVQQRSDGQRFALKEIDLRKPGMQQAMKEVETMTKLPPHRNVVRLHAHWMSSDSKDMWLLLEYCSQGTLAQLLMASTRLPDAALWDLSGQLLQALLLFERHRIVHNDIKPENIFIMEGNIPKIGDLGMARFTSVRSVLTKTPGGTPLFQSPEVLSKEMDFDGRPICFPEYAACEISYPSDVYSVGVVLWSMVMRRNPDRPGGAFPLTSALVPDSRLRNLINDMLQPDPTKRHRASHLVPRFEVPGPVPSPLSAPVPPPASVDMTSLHEFKAAISDEAAARHAYLDCLEAALPMCDAMYKRAGAASNYDEAASVLGSKKVMRAILSRIVKPTSKADIRAGLNHMRRVWQREQTDLAHQIQAAQQSAARTSAKFLEQEKAAFAGQDFALAKHMKDAKEAANRDGDRTVQKLQVNCAAFELDHICCIAEHLFRMKCFYSRLYYRTNLKRPKPPAARWSCKHMPFSAACQKCAGEEFFLRQLLFV